MNRSIDLNCDMGESYGTYSLGDDEGIISSITSANIACGFHASDPSVMARTVLLCRKHGVAVGAHPGYPDRRGFGRRFLDMAEEDLLADILYQVGALRGFLDFHRLPLRHVKLHGALYNHAAGKEDLMMRIAAHLRKAIGPFIWVTLASAEGAADLKRRWGMQGIPVALEAFPDRGYGDDGTLLNRRLPGAVIADHEEIARRALAMVREQGVESAGGRWINMEIDTLCLHGDNGDSIRAAGGIRRRLEEAGVAVRPLSCTA